MVVGPVTIGPGTRTSSTPTG